MIGLEYIRKLYDDTTITLAEKLGVTNAVISQWENGKKPIPDKRLDELSALYNVPKDYFSRELTKLEQLRIAHDNLLNKYNETIQVDEIPNYDNSGNLIGYSTEMNYDKGIGMSIQMIENDIEIEKTIQKVRDIICTGKMEENIGLINKFVSLMKSNTSVFLAYVLKAVELSEMDSSDLRNIQQWDNNLVSSLCSVMQDWRISEKKRQDAEYQEYKKLFDIDNE